MTVYIILKAILFIIGGLAFVTVIGEAWKERRDK